MAHSTTTLTVSELLDKFIQAKAQLVPRELSPKTLTNYQGAAKTIDAVLGTRQLDKLTPQDFGRLREQFGRTHGLVALNQDITLAKVIFTWAYKSGYTDGEPRYGAEFNRPRKANLRKAKAARPTRLFTADELRRILEATTGPLRAMTLLGINCGYGNSDIATLPVDAFCSIRVCFSATEPPVTYWFDHPRPKTGVPRRCPLWPETLTALKPLWNRPGTAPKLVFEPMCVSREFTAVLRDLDLYQEGRSFYSLRHTFRTVADSLPDQAAIDHIMGHARDDMASHYRHAIDDSRLLTVTNHVREWLYPPAESIS